MPQSQHKWERFPIAKVEKELNLARAAETDGSLDVPSASSEQYSSVENEVKSQVNQHAYAELELAEATIDSIENDLNRTRISLASGQFDTLRTRVRIDFSERIRRIWARISIANSELVTAEISIRNYKLSNKITRDPIVHGRSRQIASIGLLLLLLIIETSANTSLLQGAMRGGLLSALSISIAVSLINIIGSFLTGRMVIPSLFFVARSRRNLGYAALAIYSTLIIYINFVIGVFRAIAEEAIVQMNSSAVFDAARDSVYPFNDLSTLTIESVALMIFGLLFAMISLLDGYFFDDPYSAYGKLGKKYRKRRNEFDQAIDKVSELPDLERQKQNEGGSQRDRLLSLATDWGHTIDMIQNLFRTYSIATDSWVKAGDHIVDEYRKINSQYRSTPIPELFSVPLDYGVPRDTDAIFSSIRRDHISDDEKNQKLDEVVQTIEKDFQEYTTYVSTLYQETFDELNKKIDALPQH